MITATVFLVCLVNAAAKLKQNGRGAFARSFVVNVAVSLSLSFVFFPSVYWTGCELWDELLNHSAWVGWGNSHWWLAFLSFPVPHFIGSLELQVVSILFLFMRGSSFQSMTDFFYSGLAILATLFLSILSILQCRYDSFVAIHRPKRTRRIILLQSITDTLLSMAWLATFLEMLLISRVNPLYATDVTHATSLSWYFADGFAGISWCVVFEPAHFARGAVDVEILT